MFAGSRWSTARRSLVLACLTVASPGSVAPLLAQSTAPGGFVEADSDTSVRPRLTAAQIQAFLPARGEFTFPSPYNSKGIRLTNGSDCGGTDCLNYVGYSYWRNMNNHVGSNQILVFLGLDRGRGGSGPSLFSYDKVTGEVKSLGPLFDASSTYSWRTGEGWYWSATQPTKIYVDDGLRMLRYDVMSRQFETVFDITAQFGADKEIWQMHSSDDDRVHSATLRNNFGNYDMLGCMVYREDTKQFLYYPAQGGFDECEVDKSGHWLVILENIDGLYDNENVIVNLDSGVQTTIWDQDGAPGHNDTGYGYMVGADNWNPLPDATLLWTFGPTIVKGPVVHYNKNWNLGAANHIAHGNAKPGVSPDQQFACGSHADGVVDVANEIVCFRLDGSLNNLVVAPVMTDINAAGGGDNYGKEPKGNLDVTGRYFIWTTNLGGSRLDAFIVKVPYELIVGSSSDTTAPVVSVTSPLAGSSLTGIVITAASASDNVGVAGVQFLLDGAALGSEVSTAPYVISWNTAAATFGTHALTARARDAAGNTATSSPVSVTVALQDTTPPAISAVAAGSLTSSAATIAWTTDEPSDSQVEYGPTTAYGSSTPLGTALLTAHSQTLSGLASGALCHYRVKSRDTAGNLAISADATFTTLAAPPPSGDPIGYWKLDDGSGTTALDASGNGHTGTLLNGPTWIPGVVSGALSFDGLNDSVDVPHDAALDAYPLTVAAWVKTSATGLGGIVNKYYPSSWNGYQIFTTGGNLCAWYFRDASNAIWDGTTCTLMTSGFNDNRWHHVAFVVDASGGSLYVDGVVKAARAWTGTPGPTTTTLDLSLGQYPGAVQPFFPGALDDVRLYNRALSADEVLGLYGSGSSLQNVAWTNLVNATATGNSLQKTSGCDGCGDAGAVSQQQITSGDGYFEFSAPETTTLRFAGLSNGNPGTSDTEIKFAIRLQTGSVEVRESGVYRASAWFAAGDVFRVAVESGIVNYYQNGKLLYTSAQAPVYPLLIDTSLSSLNATVGNAVIWRAQ